MEAVVGKTQMEENVLLGNYKDPRGLRTVSGGRAWAGGWRELQMTRT